MTDERYFNVKMLQAIMGDVMAEPSSGRRHRRRRLHRQPHGGSAAGARASRPRHRQSGRRAARQPRAAQGRSPPRRWRARHPALAPDDALFAGARLRVSLRRHRRHRAFHRAADRIHVDQRPGHGARARMRAPRRASEIRLCRLLLLLRAGRRCRRARTIRSRRNIPTR